MTDMRRDLLAPHNALAKKVAQVLVPITLISHDELIWRMGQERDRNVGEYQRPAPTPANRPQRRR